MLQSLKKTETTIIYFTAAAIILSGFLRLLNFKCSGLVFNFSLFPYIVVRGLYYLKIWRKRNKNLTAIDKNRLYVYIGIFITILLSVIDFFSADFFVIFLIMIDFLLLKSEKKS
ncbi:MAG: hypothetical protein LBT56_08720 [Prevotellaceae bacterium]|nr:hypothetical protein [Prevotellaceae bacterium]